MQQYPHLTCFDLDLTLVNQTTSFKFGVFLYQKKIFSFPTMLYLLTWYTLHKMGLISLVTMQQKIFKKLFYGQSHAKMRLLAEDFVALNFEKMLNHSIVLKLNKAKQEGHFTAIFSSAPCFLVELFAKRLGVHEWRATAYEIDANQNFSHISHILLGKEKREHLQKLSQKLNLSPKQTTAYSDSYLDLAFLQAAGTPIAVNPDSKLRHVCKRNNWQIMHG